jgi:hypothetical protein
MKRVRVTACSEQLSHVRLCRCVASTKSQRERANPALRVRRHQLDGAGARASCSSCWQQQIKEHDGQWRLHVADSSSSRPHHPHCTATALWTPGVQVCVSTVTVTRRCLPTPAARFCWLGLALWVLPCLQASLEVRVHGGCSRLVATQPLPPTQLVRPWMTMDVRRRPGPGPPHSPPTLPPCSGR